MPVSTTVEVGPRREPVRQGPSLTTHGNHRVKSSHATTPNPHATATVSPPRGTCRSRFAQTGHDHMFIHRKLEMRLDKNGPRIRPSLSECGQGSLTHEGTARFRRPGRLATMNLSRKCDSSRYAERGSGCQGASIHTRKGILVATREAAGRSRHHEAQDAARRASVRSEGPAR